MPVDAPKQLAAAVEEALIDRAATAEMVRAGRGAFDEEYQLEAVTARMASWLRSFVR